MEPNTKPKPRQERRLVVDNYTPYRKKTVFDDVTKSYKAINVPCRHVVKEEFFTISKNTVVQTLKVFSQKNTSNPTTLLFPEESYGNKNIFRKDSGEIHRIEINIYDPDFTPFTFHIPASSNKYEKLIELRKQVERTRVIYEFNNKERPTEDVLGNYIHPPFIDPYTGREYSLYSRYSGASHDSKLGRIMNVELSDNMLFNLIIQNVGLLKNEILDGCVLKFSAVGLEDL